MQTSILATSGSLKNMRHESFAQAVVKGATDAEAYRKAGFSGIQANKRAAEIRARSDVDARIAELRRENDRLSALSREEAMASK